LRVLKHPLQGVRIDLFSFSARARFRAAVIENRNLLEFLIPLGSGQQENLEFSENVIPK
jgi:hypothetical protein